MRGGGQTIFLLNVTSAASFQDRCEFVMARTRSDSFAALVTLWPLWAAGRITPIYNDNDPNDTAIVSCRFLDGA